MGKNSRTRSYSLAELRGCLCFHTSLLVLLVAVVSFAPSLADDSSSLRPLFGDSLSGRYEKSMDLSGIIRTRLVRPDLGPLSALEHGPLPDAAATELTLDLFPGVQYVALLDTRESLRWGGTGWVGHIENCPMSEVFLVHRGELLVGSARCEGQLFQLRSSGEGRLKILELDPSSINEEQSDFELPATHSISPFEKSGYDKTDAAERIDVLVAYTSDALAAAGGTDGMNALIDLAFLETNTAYANSGISQRLRLVHSTLVDYVETGSSASDLSALYSPNDGLLDELHAQRDLYGADTVSLWTATSDACGRAYLMASVSSVYSTTAFSVIQLGCATGYYSFGHELGHNMGARHDWYVDQELNSPLSHNKGYVNLSGGWRTIMAYGNKCADSGGSCTRIQHFSNPDATYNSAATGVASGTDTSCAEGNLANPACDADNRLMLNSSAATVANYRQTQFYATLDLSASPGSVDVGETITYTLEARNDTELAASELEIEATVPEGTTLDLSSLSADALAEGTGAGNAITWITGADLAPGATTTRSFAVYADTSGMVSTQASVSSSNGAVDAPSNTVEVTVLYHAACGFSEGFEAGAFSAYWQMESTENGRARVLSSVPDTGSYSAVLDASSSGTFSESSIIMTADLDGAGESLLSFRWRDFGDEYHSGYDGVFIRADKNSAWHKVFDFSGSYHDAYQDGSVDLDGAAAAAGIVIGDGFQVRFTQYDNWYLNVAAPANGDGYGIDGISLVCSPQEIAANETVALEAVGKTGFAWGEDLNASVYKLYRGTENGLPALGDGRTEACLRWTGSTNSASGLSEEPAAGTLYWFLVTGENTLGEGSSGFHSQGERQLDSSGSCL